MTNLTLKAYYKALTTAKRYVIQEDISTNYSAVRYIATNDISKYKEDYDTFIISTEYYYEHLDTVSSMVSTIINQWTKDCYYYDWNDFLKRYDMTPYQWNNLRRIINKDN